MEFIERIETHPNAFLAPNATITGQVTVEEEASVWYQAVVRGDLAPIAIGKGSNIQDGAILHTNVDCPLTVGDGVTVGHGAILHGATIEDGALIGMGAIVLDKAVIEKGAVVGAGAIVGEGKVVPARTLVLGIPAKPVREVSEEEAAKIRENALHYRALAAAHRKRTR